VGFDGGRAALISAAARMSMIRVISHVVISGFKSVTLRHVSQRIRLSSSVTNDFHEWGYSSVIKIFSAFNGSLIDLKSASHPWGSCRLVVALRALLLVFFVGVVFFAWVVLILFYQEKVPASGSAETLSPRSITCARYPKTGTQFSVCCRSEVMASVLRNADRCFSADDPHLHLPHHHGNKKPARFPGRAASALV
jgi:hypothetical protein